MVPRLGERQSATWGPRPSLGPRRGDSAFDAAREGLLQDHEEAEQAQEGRLAVDAHAVFEGPHPRAIRERPGFAVHVVGEGGGFGFEYRRPRSLRRTRGC